MGTRQERKEKMLKPEVPVILGPMGGNVMQAHLHPERRRAGLDDSATGLHRFDSNHDSATPGIKNEQPWHLMAAYMVNAGRTNSEIAMAAEVSVNYVSHVRAQKWFQQRCAQIANDFGEEVVGAIKGYALAAVEKIADLMNGAESERVQLSASQIILEQVQGKPTQKVISHSTHSSLDPVEEVDQIRRELAAIQSQS